MDKTRMRHWSLPRDRWPDDGQRYRRRQRSAAVRFLATLTSATGSDPNNGHGLNAFKLSIRNNPIQRCNSKNNMPPFDYYRTTLIGCHRFGFGSGIGSESERNCRFPSGPDCLSDAKPKRESPLRLVRILALFATLVSPIQCDFAGGQAPVHFSSVANDWTFFSKSAVNVPTEPGRGGNFAASSEQPMHLIGAKQVVPVYLVANYEMRRPRRSASVGIGGQTVGRQLERQMTSRQSHFDQAAYRQNLTHGQTLNRSTLTYSAIASTPNALANRMGEFASADYDFGFGEPQAAPLSQTIGGGSAFGRNGAEDGVANADDDEDDDDDDDALNRTQNRPRRRPQPQSPPVANRTAPPSSSSSLMKPSEQATPDYDFHFAVSPVASNSSSNDDAESELQPAKRPLEDENKSDDYNQQVGQPLLATQPTANNSSSGGSKNSFGEHYDTMDSANSSDEVLKQATEALRRPNTAAVSKIINAEMSRAAASSLTTTAVPARKSGSGGVGGAGSNHAGQVSNYAQAPPLPLVGKHKSGSQSPSALSSARFSKLLASSSSPSLKQQQQQQQQQARQHLTVPNILADGRQKLADGRQQSAALAVGSVQGGSGGDSGSSGLPSSPSTKSDATRYHTIKPNAYPRAPVHAKTRLPLANLTPPVLNGTDAPLNGLKSSQDFAKVFWNSSGKENRQLSGNKLVSSASDLQKIRPKQMQLNETGADFEKDELEVEAGLANSVLLAKGAPKSPRANNSRSKVSLPLPTKRVRQRGSLEDEEEEHFAVAIIPGKGRQATKAVSSLSKVSPKREPPLKNSWNELLDSLNSYKPNDSNEHDDERFAQKAKLRSSTVQPQTKGVKAPAAMSLNVNNQKRLARTVTENKTTTANQSRTDVTKPIAVDAKSDADDRRQNKTFYITIESGLPTTANSLGKQQVPLEGGNDIEGTQIPEAEKSRSIDRQFELNETQVVSQSGTKANTRRRALDKLVVNDLSTAASRPNNPLFMLSTGRIYPKRDPSKAPQNGIVHSPLHQPSLLLSSLTRNTSNLESALARNQEARASIVRSGFVVPSGPPISSMQTFLPFPNRLATWASSHPLSLLSQAQRQQQQFQNPILAAQQSGPIWAALHSNLRQESEQQRAIGHLKAALLVASQQQQQQPTESRLPGTFLSDSSLLSTPVAATTGLDFLNASNNNLQQPQLKNVDQMLATANQIDVSHLGPQILSVGADSSGSYGQMMDYQIDGSPSVRSSRADGGGGGGSGGGVASSLDSATLTSGTGNVEQQQQQQPVVDQMNGNSRPTNGASQQEQNSQANGSGGSYNSDYASPHPRHAPSGGDGPPQPDSAAQPDGQVGGGGGGYSFFEQTTPRNYSSSSSNGEFYWPTRSAHVDAYPSNVRSTSEPKFSANNADQQPSNIMPSSLRSSLDPFEEYAGSSTSEYERDLADLDDEFNRHAVFSSRPSRPTTSGHHHNRNLVSDSMLTYSPERYESVRFHYSPQARGRIQSPFHSHEISASAQPSSSGSVSSGPPPLVGMGDYFNTAGSVTNIIPRPYTHHHHHYQSHYPHLNQRIAAMLPSASSASAFSSPPQTESEMSSAAAGSALWLSDSSHDMSSLASLLSTGTGSSSNPYTRWRTHSRYSHPYPHQYHHHQPMAAASMPTMQRSISPYLTLAPGTLGASSPSYQSSAASEQSAYNFIPNYAAPSTSSASILPTETISFTMSPLAAAAAAAATALAAADKSRQQQHAWTITLPRLASALAAASQVAPGPGIATAASSQGPSLTSGSPFHQAYSSPYRPGGSSYLLSPMPLYAIASRAPGASPISTAASGAIPSIVPIHAFHPSAGGSGPALFAYRPTSVFAPTPLLTSFALPFRVPLASTIGSSQYPLSSAASSSLDHFNHGQASHLNLRLKSPSPSASSSASITSSASASSSGRGSQLSASGAEHNHHHHLHSLRPFYADLQLAESKPKLNNGHHHSSNSKNIVKSTAGGLSQMARNLSKKMFGSASQIRPQFVEPPANFEAFGQTTVLSSAPSSLATLAAATVSTLAGSNQMQSALSSSNQQAQPATGTAQLQA